MKKRTRAERGLWWDRAWGLAQGCTPVSAACKNCWSREFHNRFREYRKLPPFSEVRFRADRLDIPPRRGIPTWYSVWNDAFHPAVTDKNLVEMFDAIRGARQHTYVLLTKRIKRAADDLGDVGRQFPNVIIGTTVENQAAADERMPHLARLAAMGWRTMVSAEPLLEYTELDIIRYGPLAWLIVGAESGPRHRRCDPGWVCSLIDQADAADVPVWVKQLELGRDISNTPADWPKWARRRERPKEE